MTVTSPSNEETKPEPKQTVMCSSEEPDVVIVVGGKEYLEYRQKLRCWSGFFDAAFRSGMKESKAMRFEFADKDPKEWQLVVSLVSPLSPDQVTQDNVQVVLPWFDELDCNRGLKACDRVLESMVANTLHDSPEDTLDSILDLAETSRQCNLSATKAKCLARIRTSVL